MKCPLHGKEKSIYKNGVWQGSAWEFVDCVKEQCAWWDPKYKECSIKIVACWLPLIEDNTKEIARRRPYA